MKHLKTITLLITLLTFSSLCFSHGSTTTRSKCRWYAKKYRAYARVNNGPGIKIQTQSGCGGTYTASVSYPCVWQQSTNSWGASYFSGAVTATPWLCGRGFEKSELIYELIEPAAMQEGNYGEEADISNKDYITLNSDNTNFYYTPQRGQNKAKDLKVILKEYCQSVGIINFSHTRYCEECYKKTLKEAPRISLIVD